MIDIICLLAASFDVQPLSLLVSTLHTTNSGGCILLEITPPRESTVNHRQSHPLAYSITVLLPNTAAGFVHRKDNPPCQLSSHWSLAIGHHVIRPNKARLHACTCCLLCTWLCLKSSKENIGEILRVYEPSRCVLFA